MRSPQCVQIKNWLEAGFAITAGEALQMFSVGHLASRISDLKKEGMQIDKAMVEVKNQYGETCRVARYTLGRPTHDGDQGLMRMGEI